MQEVIVFLIATSIVLLIQEKGKDFKKDAPTCFLDGWVGFYKVVMSLFSNIKEAMQSKKADKEDVDSTSTDKPE
ncbi:hypothetical protein [Vibrio alginolyticus]|uniref:hypothetical protein n=1 Tax=Vibrio TaxID=662 RepID=UPI0006CA8BE7|nr:hypothetical protein [Vibrio alginolyticus]KPM98556.1 hypothetical protein AOG25_08950 [Vibrio alginolyticus]CAH7153277.1 conserved hypothetical protein [Vibrio chagasii]CAH7323522.1 conserved hypothetical protein [Vibrio chagasii]